MSVEGVYHAIGDFPRIDLATDMAHGFALSLAFGFGWGGE